MPLYQRPDAMTVASKQILAGTYKHEERSHGDRCSSLIENPWIVIRNAAMGRRLIAARGRPLASHAVPALLPLNSRGVGLRPGHGAICASSQTTQHARVSWSREVLSCRKGSVR